MNTPLALHADPKTSESARAHALCSMRLATQHDGQVVLTVAGMLLLSKVNKWQMHYSRPCFGIQVGVQLCTATCWSTHHPQLQAIGGGYE